MIQYAWGTQQDGGFLTTCVDNTQHPSDDTIPPLDTDKEIKKMEPPAWSFISFSVLNYVGIQFG